MYNDSVKINTHIFISYVYKNEDSQFKGSMPSAHSFYLLFIFIAFFPLSSSSLLQKHAFQVFRIFDRKS